MFKLTGIGKVTTSGESTIEQFRNKVYEELIKDKDNIASKVVTSADQLRIRNPRNEDLGDVMALVQKYS